MAVTLVAVDFSSDQMVGFLIIFGLFHDSVATDDNFLWFLKNEENYFFGGEEENCALIACNV